LLLTCVLFSLHSTTLHTKSIGKAYKFFIESLFSHRALMLNWRKDSTAEGKKTALFIGRTHNEEMPHKEGYVWFSLNVRNPKPTEKTKIRWGFHLQINFEDEERLSKIENLFDEVVVDVETYKFFDRCKDDPLLVDKSNYKFSKGLRDVPIQFYHEETAKKLISLLKPGGEERLICDFAPRKDSLRNEELKELIRSSLPPDHPHLDKMVDGILQNRHVLKRGSTQKELILNAEAWYGHLEKLEIMGMLKDLFEKVDHAPGPLPYPIYCYGGIHAYTGPSTHFIAQGIIKQMQEGMQDNVIEKRPSLREDLEKKSVISAFVKTIWAIHYTMAEVDILSQRSGNSGLSLAFLENIETEMLGLRRKISATQDIQRLLQEEPEIIEILKYSLEMLDTIQEKYDIMKNEISRKAQVDWSNFDSKKAIAVQHRLDASKEIEGFYTQLH
ncbi:MAG: hypothetical protein WBD50_05400, partial [Candidatus Rhabdochlamydia sp.]